MARMSLQAAYHQARQWLESNDLDRAIGLAQHILDSYPNNLEAYRILGEGYLAHRQLDRAQEVFERVLRSDPENIPAHVGLGITFERRGQLERAVTEFEQALEIKPDMPELRSQLLRLYSEAWGSENAQLRLSRAGLARLYAKGHMLPQAIGEFRQVIGENPERFDARVALAETLWRNEQEDDAAEVCRQILAERPESLKANLILGYLELAAGRPEGEHYWQTAYGMDPDQVVAQALFETLPPMPEEPTLPEWDEDAWRRRHDAELYEEQIAATRPMDGTTLVIDDERDTPVLRATPPAPAAPPAPTLTPDEDDFLASLFALDMPPVFVDPPAPLAPETPEPAASPNADAAEEEASQEATEPDLTPFSLADLGLSDDEIAELEAADTPGQPAASETNAVDRTDAADASDEEPQLTPFSLADLGLSDDEIAGLDSIDDLAPSATAASSAEQQPQDVEPEITPFSLADLGLSDDEITGLESVQTSGASQSGASAEDELGDLPEDLQPFSMDELDLSGGADRGDLGDLPSSLQPFSLDDTSQQPQRPRMSGLQADELYENSTDEDESPPSPRGFSWQQPAQRSEPGFVASMRPEQEPAQGSIFEKLQQTRPAQPEEEPVAPTPIESDEHLGLFSLDDVSLRDDESEAPIDGAPTAQSDTPVHSTPHVQQPAPEVDNLEDALASGAIQPFSFADLGLSEEEIAALGLGQSEPSATTDADDPAMSLPDVAQEAEPLANEPEQPATPAPAPQDETTTAEAEQPTVPPAAATEAEEPPQTEPEVDNLEDALASGAIQPFSFADLGLSEEEIAALGLGQAEPATPEAEADAVPAETLYLKLEDLDPGDADAAAADADDPLADAGELQPFSLHDLGLSDEEIDELELDLEDGTRLGLTEDELAGLASGGDVDWNAISTPEPAPPAAMPEQVTSGDLVVDRLIALGREQGFVDIADIMAAVDDPEEQAERIEEIGQRLHTANIEIRDGDEVIDMDAEYAEDEPASPLDAMDPAISVAGEAMTPFSLHDLGLTDEEIAMLGLGGDAESPPGQQDEPALEPLTPGDLGEASREPATLDLAEPVSPGVAEPVDETEVLEPFSLSELGLTDDEIAMLGLGESQTPAPDDTPAAPKPMAAPTTEPEPVVTPSEPELLAAAVPSPAAEPAQALVQPTGNQVLDMFVRQLEADPQNHVLRLAIARVGAQAGMDDLSVQQYRDLIKRSALLDDVVSDLSDLISENDDERVLRRLHKTLGDAYSKQGRFNEAMTAYSWTPHNR